CWSFGISRYSIAAGIWTVVNALMLGLNQLIAVTMPRTRRLSVTTETLPLKWLASRRSFIAPRWVAFGLAVAHQHRDLEGPVLALAALGLGELVIEVAQRQHPVVHVAGLVGDHVL